MEELKLIVPTEADLDQVWAYRQDCDAAGSGMEGCGGLAFVESPQQWLEDIRRYSDPATVPEGRVAATQFLAIRVSDGRLVGMLNFRHGLTDYLRRFGGHIGYSIRPGERLKGYGTQQLRLALPHGRELGLDRVLVACGDWNTGSRKIILNCGGVFEGAELDPEQQKTFERYWITL